MGVCTSTNKNKNNNKSKKIDDLEQNEKVLLECKMCRDKIKNYIKKCELTALKKTFKSKRIIKK